MLLLYFGWDSESLDLVIGSEVVWLWIVINVKKVIGIFFLGFLFFNCVFFGRVGV